MANYSIARDLPEVEPGHVFEGDNFTRLNANTKIFVGITGLVFRRCNLTNCIVPADATIEECLVVQKEFCSNLHPTWVAKGLTECSGEHCSHVVDTSVITIDGVVVDTTYEYEDTIL